MSRIYLHCYILVLLASSFKKPNCEVLEIAVGPWDRFIGKTTLFQSTANSMYKKNRRSAGFINGFPPSLSFTFRMGNNDVRLNLRKNFFMDLSPPFFVVRQGRIVREVNHDLINNYAYYQDKETGAAVMVSLEFGANDYLLTGNYFHDGEEYSIRPLTGNRSLGAEHVIYKLYHEPNAEVNPGLRKDMKQDSVINVSKENPTNTGGMRSSSNTGTIKTTYEVITKSSITTGLNIETPQDFLYMPNPNTAMDDGSDNSENGSVNLALSGGDVRIVDGSGVVQGRKKRQAKVYVVELLVVIDYGVYEVWLNGVSGLNEEARRNEALHRIKQFYSFVLNGIDVRYNSVQRSADFTIDVTWAGIVVFDKPDPGFWKNSTNRPQSSRNLVESSAALEAFRNWAASDGLDLPPSDHVMLFTGHNLTYGGSVSNAGLAYLGSACNVEYYFSIVEEYFEFRDVAIAAHELGHSLGARHDMDGNTCLSFDRYIMTPRFQFPTFRKAQNPWLFSPCSIDYFKAFIEALNKNDTNCLVTKESQTDNKEIQPFLNSLPGEVYAGDDFCRIGDGAESYICRDQHLSDYSSICFAGVYCYSPTEKHCFPKLPPDGFSCGKKKWCLNGTCQFSELAPATQGDDCPFGDDPGLVEGKTCSEVLRISRSNCYRDLFRARCCLSCYDNKLNLPGCEYGDTFELCQQDQCSNYDIDYAKENCCKTCSQLLYTPSPGEGTNTTVLWDGMRTTAAPVETGTTTRQFIEVFRTTNRGGITTRQFIEVFRTTNRAKLEENAHRRTTVAPFARPGLGSEENGSSDEKSQKFNNVRNMIFRLRPRGLKPSNKRTERLNHILSLLRNHRDNTPLQHMRLLLNILYHARHGDAYINIGRFKDLEFYTSLVQNKSASIREQLRNISHKRETSETITAANELSNPKAGEIKTSNGDEIDRDRGGEDGDEENSEESK